MEIRNAWIRFDETNTIAWYVGGDPLKEYVGDKMAREYKISLEEINTLCNADELSLAAEEELSVYRSIIACRKGADLKKLAKILSKDYGWIPHGYDGPGFWDQKFYEKKIKKTGKSIPYLKDKIAMLENQAEETKQKQNKIAKRYKINAEMQRLLKVIRKLYVMTDERKKFEFQLHYAYHNILNELVKISGLTILELKYLLVEEIAEMFKSKRFSFFKALAKKRINNPMVLYVTRGKVVYIKTGKVVLNELKKFTTEVKNINEISGQVASKVGKSKIRGKVRLIMDSRNVNSMRQNEVLVTTMTTPDFVPAMRKAKAIITDEGGITSHAAIVSRELRINCIIGTKIATKVFKDGDMVEVDAEKGVVRRIDKR